MLLSARYTQTYNLNPFCEIALHRLSRDQTMTDRQLFTDDPAACVGEEHKDFGGVPFPACSWNSPFSQAVLLFTAPLPHLVR